VDLKLLMFNNRIYGLTKGQVSPTSELYKKTKTTPHGSPDYPFNAPALALGAGATFVARGIDVEGPHLGACLKAAQDHKGTAFVEILQNCPVFNDGAHAQLTDKASKADTQLRMEHGKPLLFGKDNRKGIRFNPRTAVLEVVTVGEGGVTEADILVHDAGREDPTMAFMLANLTSTPGFPTPIGVFRAVRKPTADEITWELIGKAKAATKKPLSVTEFLSQGETWTVK
jgi:2-oxoglutarate ferredoxin oxidoreductase subunit beta